MVWYRGMYIKEGGGYLRRVGVGTSRRKGHLYRVGRGDGMEIGKEGGRMIFCRISYCTSE